MAKKRSYRHHGTPPRPALHKPKGFFQDRVQRAGPAHFGIACFDCHKEYTKWMFADYFGQILIPCQLLPHTRTALQAAVTLLQNTIQQRQLKDVIVVIERTGRYHHILERVLRAAGFDIRIVHPFATKQFRQAAHPGDKTDDHDLIALHCAALNGFALAEAERDEFWTSLLHIARYR